MATRHTPSHADQIFMGNVYYARAHNANRGTPFGALYAQDMGTPVVADPDRILDDSTATDSAQVVTSFLAQPDVPRALTATGTAGSNHVILVHGLDVWGHPITEQLTLNGTNVIAGKKAFASVVQVNVAAGATNDTFDLGVGDVLGFDYRVDAGGLLGVTFGTTLYDAATFVAAVTTDPATATTGDVRGTINPNGTLNGSTKVVAFYHIGPPDQHLPTSKVEAYGVDQFYSGP